MQPVIFHKEICRLDYGDGDFEKLMVEESKNNEPFYYIEHRYGTTPVETSSHNLNAIIVFLERRLQISKNNYRNNYNIHIMDVMDKIHALQENFINQIKDYHAKLLLSK